MLALANECCYTCSSRNNTSINRSSKHPVTNCNKYLRVLISTARVTVAVAMAIVIQRTARTNSRLDNGFCCQRCVTKPPHVGGGLCKLVQMTRNELIGKRIDLLATLHAYGCHPIPTTNKYMACNLVCAWYLTSKLFTAHPCVTM